MSSPIAIQERYLAMNPQHDKILGLIASLKKANENYVRNSGMGYCACASQDLQNHLSKLGIESKLLYGKHLSNNDAGNKAKAHFKNLIANFPIGNDFHGRVKRHFVKNNNQLSDKGGHVGVLVGETVYDVTSAQFGLPITYPLNDFLNMWDTVAVVEIKLKPTNTSWNQAVQYSYKSKNKSNISQESFQDTVEYAMESFIDEADTDTDREDFYQWFSTQSKEVQANSKIVSAGEVGQDYMLHIDKQTPAKFIPMLSRRAGKTENNTVPRITVSPTLVGCLIGYAAAENDTINGTLKEENNETKFRGGYDICELRFKHCLCPNSKLVYDASRSQEHWFVSYNKQTQEYAPVKIGKMFASKLTYEPVSGGMPAVTFEMYVEVHKEEGIKLSPNIHLDKGFYCAIIKFENKEHPGSVSEEHLFKVNSISAGEYNKAKQLSAAMLSHQDKVPKYLNW